MWHFTHCTFIRSQFDKQCSRKYDTKPNEATNRLTNKIHYPEESPGHQSASETLITIARQCKNEWNYFVYKWALQKVLAKNSFSLKLNLRERENKKTHTGQITMMIAEGCLGRTATRMNRLRCWLDLTRLLFEHLPSGYFSHSKRKHRIVNGARVTNCETLEIINKKLNTTGP